MGDLTKNLSRHEFECRCGCGFDTVDFELVMMLQTAADDFAIEYNSKIVIDIRGGNRCAEHNEFVQKKYNPNYIPFSSKSRHMKADASDVKFWYYENGIKKQIPPKKTYDYYDKKYPTNKGLGIYNNRIHLDARRSKARWVG